MAIQQSSISLFMPLNPNSQRLVFRKESTCVARSHTCAYRPRACRTEYIPGLVDESNSPYVAYKSKYSSSPFDDNTIETGWKHTS